MFRIRSLAFVVFFAMCAPSTSLLSQSCDVKCDLHVRCARLTSTQHNQSKQFKWDAVLLFNTDVNDGASISGTTPNEWRFATGTRVCPYLVDGLVIIWGKSSDCTSNNDWEPKNTGETCVDPGCTGQSGPICAPNG